MTCQGIQLDISQAARAFSTLNAVLAPLAVTAIVLLITLGRPLADATEDRTAQETTRLFTRPLTLLSVVFFDALLAAFLFSIAGSGTSCRATYLESVLAG